MENTYTTLAPYIALGGWAVSAFLFWKRGGSAATEKLIEIQNTQIALQETQIQTLRDDLKIRADRHHEMGNFVQGLSGKVAKMEGQLEEKDKKIDELMRILENRNPELDIFIKRITELADNAATYIQQNQTNMEEIKQFMRSLNSRAGAMETRNVAIDSATAKKQGKVMRKKG